ncbi:MAG TPA: polysaccharide deacetylase family protein [Candidatus Borkfalkia faecavium]|uniref:Polysaccharide deacetylase family protein n=1 Tax=Candidatus Borkfalkia faecavium TaxID=2838508 RepID=A0A9D1VZC6_9FIRM|nr:polysaccharide deacetylase family protein [Candidatus Borkfalkia faecavium]
MKRNRKLAIVSNICLAAVVFAVACVCLYPVGVSTSGGSGRILTGGDRGGAQISLLLSVYEGEEYIPPILDVLDEYGAKATFFVGGSWADGHAGALREIASRGHEVGNFGYFERDMSALPQEKCEQELRLCGALVEALTGARPSLFLPPCGAYGDGLLDAAEALGYTPVLWSKDAACADAALVCERAAEGEAGDFVRLLPSAETLSALPSVLRGFEERGLSAVTLSACIGGHA